MTEKIRIVIYGMYKFQLTVEDFAKFITETRDKTCYRVSDIKELKLHIWDLKFTLPKNGEKPVPDETVERDIIVDVNAIAESATDFYKAEEDVINLVIESVKRELLKDVPKKEEKNKWWKFW